MGLLFVAAPPAVSLCHCDDTCPEFWDPGWEDYLHEAMPCGDEEDEETGADDDMPSSDATAFTAGQLDVLARVYVVGGSMSGGGVLMAAPGDVGVVYVALSRNVPLPVPDDPMNESVPSIPGTIVLDADDEVEWDEEPEYDFTYVSPYQIQVQPGFYFEIDGDAGDGNLVITVNVTANGTAAERDIFFYVDADEPETLTPSTTPATTPISTGLTSPPAVVDEENNTPLGSWVVLASVLASAALFARWRKRA